METMLWPIVTLLTLGVFWARAPHPLAVGPIPTVLVVFATLALAAESFVFSAFLIVAAGFARSYAVGYARNKPRSAVTGVVFAAGVMLAATGTLAPMFALVPVAVIVFLDVKESYGRVRVEEEYVDSDF